MRSLPYAYAAMAVLALPGAASAQGAQTPPAPRGCRGVTLQTSSITVPAPLGGEAIEFPSYPVVETIQPGSPAELAGFRVGDVNVLQDGRDLVGKGPPERAPVAGDTVHFVVRRNGVEVPLVVVLGRWDPPEEAEGVTRMCRPVQPTVN
jgi:S1-C subfamily serine protease